ncbi:MAG: hypothetical protein NTY79_03295 [Chloroflexi bacterium]|nr:hypothetical protein [Chloroflexota bacterium]
MVFLPCQGLCFTSMRLSLKTYPAWLQHLPSAHFADARLVKLEKLEKNYQQLMLEEDISMSDFK